MRKIIPFLLICCCSLISCIKDAPLNPEADILTFNFPEGSLRTKNVEIYNDYIVTYPKKGVDLLNSEFDLTATPGAVWERMEKNTPNDTLFYIKVTSQSKEYSKVYAILQVENFPDLFDFEEWIKISNYYQYLNPKEGSMQFYSSNNGAAIAWNKRDKTSDEYLARPTSTCVSGQKAAELRTMEGPGNIAGGVRFIPCLAGSLYLGGFDALTGLTEPLKSTKFGVPFNSGKPVKFTGHYIYKQGDKDYINGKDGSKDPLKSDTCAIYATLFKTDKDVQFLYGDNVSTSKNIIARAQMDPKDIKEGDEFVYFEIPFDYQSFTTPFRTEELMNNEYKITIVCSSSKNGAYYEGRPGSHLIVDNIKVEYEVIE